MATKKLNKFFDHNEVEKRLYKRWLDKGYFKASNRKNTKKFSIVMPPPNITSQLHIGHALDLTYADIVVRIKRMQGYDTLWLPGTDHASIATEAKICQALRKEDKDKFKLGREKFLEIAWEWKKTYGTRIVEQVKSLGASCDWSRERFTMDEGLSKAVNHVFVKLYEKDLIYRGEKIINWCSHCKTTISDAEIEYMEENSKLWYIRYKIENSDDFVVVATSRPETLLGDTAVAVNPDDERYAHLKGKYVILPISNKRIPVVFDNYVEKDFGTGVVKITPAHDPNDYEVGLRHNLPIVNTFTEDGYLNEMAGEFCGLTLKEGRHKIAERLKELGLLEKIEPYKHNVACCYRCFNVVEPRLSKQWFVKMQDLAQPAIDVVKNKKINFVPERFDKIYYNWMENIRDWCISRQLWWGHRIPAYYNDRTGEVYVSEEKMFFDPKTKEPLRQDEDTLDTWFSSALWPFTTLGWPDENNEDYKNFYPTSLMVTGYDIIFFWVARMIFSALEQTGNIPFKDVLLHGLVRDEQGRKMSKSLGNGVDPLEVIDEYGCDTLRYALVDNVSTGNDLRFQKDKLEFAKSFSTKLWNAFKFLNTYLQEDLDFTIFSEANLQPEDKWILSKLNSLIKKVNVNIDKYELGIALSNIVDFIWNNYCDWYIEMTKSRLYDENNYSRLEAIYVLREVLSSVLKLLHPFMPFISSEVYANLYGNELEDETQDLMISSWPEFEEKYLDLQAESDMEDLMSAIRELRALRLKFQVPSNKKPNIYLLCDDEALAKFFIKSEPYLQRLASVGNLIKLQDRRDILPKSASITLNKVELFVAMNELIDMAKEKKRLEAEKIKYEEELLRVKKKLANQDFMAKAPPHIIDNEKEKLEKYTNILASISEQLKDF